MRVCCFLVNYLDVYRWASGVRVRRGGSHLTAVTRKALSRGRRGRPLGVPRKFLGFDLGLVGWIGAGDGRRGRPRVESIDGCRYHAIHELGMLALTFRSCQSFVSAHIGCPRRLDKGVSGITRWPIVNAHIVGPRRALVLFVAAVAVVGVVVVVLPRVIEHAGDRNIPGFE